MPISGRLILCVALIGVLAALTSAREVHAFGILIPTKTIPPSGVKAMRAVVVRNDTTLRRTYQVRFDWTSPTKLVWVVPVRPGVSVRVEHLCSEIFTELEDATAPVAATYHRQATSACGNDEWMTAPEEAALITTFTWPVTQDTALEVLTEELARGAWERFQEIESAGGMGKALLSGEISKE